MVTCVCGCGTPVSSRSYYTRGHQHRGRTQSPEWIEKRTAPRRKSVPNAVKCACGCEEKASPGKIYVHGHHRRGIPGVSLLGSLNPSWRGDDAPASAKYGRAHKEAKRRLGAKPDRCPTCGKIRRLELSYTGITPTHFDDRQRPYDPTGVEYIYECHPCNVKRGYAVRRSNVKGPVDGSISA